MNQEICLVALLDYTFCSRIQELVQLEYSHSVCKSQIISKYYIRWKLNSVALTQCEDLRSHHTRPPELGEDPNEKGSQMALCLQN